MRASILLSFAVVLLLAVNVPPCTAGSQNRELNRILPSVVTTILDTVVHINMGDKHRWGGRFTFLKKQCTLTTTDRRGKTDAEMRCDGWPLEGKARGADSTYKAMAEVIRMYVQSAEKIGLLTVSELRDWLIADAQKYYPDQNEDY